MSDSVIQSAVLEVVKGNAKLLEIGSLEMDILRHIATTLDNLTTWLQQPPSNALPELLADIVSKLDGAHAKLDWVCARLNDNR